MKIATWNVNSVRARLPHVQDWLKEAAPDVLLLQELKCVTEAFPYMEIEDLGYNVAAHGQKTYNGVAILSKHPIEDVITTLPGDETDEEARYIEAVIDGGDKVVRVASIYLPNGGEPDGPRFPYKLKFIERLREHAKELLTYDEMLILGGDYNVAPDPIDVHDPQKLDGTTCYHPDERERFRGIMHLGFTDVWRAKHPHAQHFSWWDYRGGGYQNNTGMRIDHLLASPEAADRITNAEIDEAPRGKEKASDHAPVWCEIT
jgi:exodeoxyribonuclease-3